MKTLFAAVGTAALLALAAGTAGAQGTMNCSAAYKTAFEQISKVAPAKMTPEQLAGINRQALRAYDACLSGDEASAKSIFDRIAKMAGN
jgi:hypothetical protein